MKLKNEFWAFIPARSGSKAILNKNIKKLNKLPLIAYSILAAKKKQKYQKYCIFIRFFRLLQNCKKICSYNLSQEK